MKRYDFAFLVLSGLFLSSLVIANSLVFKFFDIQLPFVGAVTLSVGIIPYPVTFLCTDLVSELYGKRRADALVLTGLICSIWMIFLLQVGRVLPVSHLQSPEIQEHYVAVFGSSTRAIIASMLAYLVAQFLDVRLYHFWWRVTKGRHLWIRNNFSTMLSQFFDTAVVVTVLFAGIWAPSDIWNTIVAGYVFKLIMAAADTPFMYLGTWLLRDVKEHSRSLGLIAH